MQSLPDVISFDEALKRSQQYTKRLLLLGNGFSIGCFPDIFRYSTLFDQADFSQTQELSDVFNRLKTNDFEIVIKTLEDIVNVVPIYGGNPDWLNKISSQAYKLRKILIQTITNNHPDFPAKISDKKVKSCRQFLNHFVGSKTNGKIYSLNYDLLLYWILMHDDPIKDELLPLASNDGFGRDEETLDTEYVIWKGEDDADEQRIFYLHGALHLFDAGSELHKYTWRNTGVTLKRQVQRAIDGNRFPLFVAEGTRVQKLEKIRHSAYLQHAYKSFSKEMKGSNKCLFIYGHSLSNNDRHILRKISNGKIKEVFISLNGDVKKENNQKIIIAAEALGIERRIGNPLMVTFYDALSAKIWAT